MTARRGPSPSAVNTMLERRLLVFVLLVTAAGLALPGPGRAVDAHNGVPVVLSVLVLSAGLGVDGAGLRRLRGALGPVVVTLGVSTVTLPGLAWLAGRLVADPGLRGGVLAAGVAPAEVASVALSGLAGTDVALAASLLISTTVATVLLAGPLLMLLAGTPTSTVLSGLVVTLVLVVALPLTIGVAARARWPAAPPVIGAPLLGTVVLLVLVYLVAVQIPLSTAYLPVVPALLAFLAGSALLGGLLARLFTPARRPAVLLPIAMRDFAVAAGIADTAFGHTALAPLGVYGFLVLLFGALATRRATRSPTTRHAPR